MKGYQKKSYKRASKWKMTGKEVRFRKQIAIARGGRRK